MTTKGEYRSAEMLMGEKVSAKYIDPQVASYRDNPLIEALPPVLSKEQFWDIATHLPDYDESERLLPSHLRLHLILGSISQVFQPFDWHTDLEQRISRAMRVGYLNRNSIKKDYWKQTDEIVSGWATQYPVGRNLRNTMLGFALIGRSGLGKTVALETVLSLYPQVIFHNKYKGKRWTFTQVVWLKLDCPPDGSIKGLCFNFFQALDEILGTSYENRYTKGAGGTTVDKMLPHITRLTRNHGIGLLVVDEIQRLSHAKSGGAEKMLAFFEYLVSKVGMPVITVGTHKARVILGNSFAQARRSAGQGDFVLERLRFDDGTWELFLESIWDYQYVSNNTPLTPELSQILYEESQGICDIAAKLYIFSQIRAIETGQEIITAEIIQSVADDKLVLLRDYLQALRTGDFKKLQNMDDVELPDMDEYVKSVSDQLRKHAVEISAKPEIIDRLKNQDTSIDESLKTVKTDTQMFRMPTSNHVEGSLIAIVAAATENGISHYKALQEAGLIRPITAFFTQ